MTRPSSRSVPLSIGLVEHMGGKRLEAGQGIHVEFEEGRIHLFDMEDGGKRIGPA